MMKGEGKSEEHSCVTRVCSVASLTVAKAAQLGLPHPSRTTRPRPSHPHPRMELEKPSITDLHPTRAYGGQLLPTTTGNYCKDYRELSRSPRDGFWISRGLRVK